jgi:predicted protein tyrosine phosphatase
MRFWERFYLRIRRHVPLARQPYHISWLTAGLAVARAPRSHEWRRISAAGISAVVDLRAEALDTGQLALAHGIEYLRLPVMEHDVPTEAELLQVTDWICERLAQDKAVLVHCRAGMGRSPLVACAALVRRGDSLATAYDLLRRARPWASMTEVQASLLEAFAVRHSAAGGERL